MVMWKGCRFMKKKFLALAMAMVLAAATFTGCGSAARTETSEITTEAATEAMPEILFLLQVTKS